MVDREKVIKALEVCSTGHCEISCPYNNVPQCTRAILSDSLALLKEQGAREPHYTTLRYLVNGMEAVVHHPECPRCIENGLMLWDAEIEKGQAYCKRCGQAVKWE